MQRLTKEQAAIIGTYTGISCGPFGDIHEYIEKILGHPVWTHQLVDPVLLEKVKEKSKPDFLALCYEESK